MRRDTCNFIDMLYIHGRNNVFQLLFRTGVIPGQCRAHNIIIIIKQDTGFANTGDRYCTNLLCITQIIGYCFEAIKNAFPDEANIKISIFSVFNFGRLKSVLIN
ncbi:hypothetical protein NGUA11_04612 [Salmonella enterica]|nr:hypothetical protein NGUA11_04612 [Salmonella enterica]GAS53874.1 hypothetical protein NGUA36_01148 [Salmonella enterica]